MDEYQKAGDALATAITKGDAEEAYRILQDMVALDAEFEVFVQRNGEDLKEEKKAVDVPGRGKQGDKIEKAPQGDKAENPKNEIYEKLIEMGVDRNKALSIAGKCKSLDEALSVAFSE